MRVFGEDGEEIGAVEGVLHLEESEVYRLFGAERGWMDGRALPAHPEGGLVLRTPAVVGRGALSDGGAEVAVQIRAKASKLPEGLYLRVLEELEGALPGLSLGAQAERSGSVGQGAPVPLAVVAVEALLPVLPVLEAALERLAARPALEEGGRWAEVPLAALRRVDAPVLRARAERPDRERVPVWQAEDRPDTRWLGLAAERVRQVAARLERAAVWLRGRGGPVAVVRAGRLREGAARLQAGRRPFAGMEGGPGTPGGAPEAPVASVLRLCRFFLSPLFEVRDGPNPAMVRPSWQIYEMWCFFTLQRRLAALLPGWAWEERGLERLLQEPERPAGEEPADAGIGFTARGPGAVLWIDFNPVFPGYLDAQPADARRFTLSQPRRPDLAVGVQDGRGGRWICLDAKWRAGRWRLGDALSAAHVYRDALRDRAHGGAPLASLLLAPSCTGEVAPWFDSSFIEEHGVGILEYRPDQGSGEAWLLGRLGVRAG